ncbi:MAG: response regulator [Pseudomonadota bacterium]|nr:response regulator [Pseudomonadota bacterium]
MTNASPSSSGRKLRALVVEDEALVAMMMSEMLEDLGHEVAASASTMEEAIEVARSGAFDFAILDLNLAGKEAYPIADELKKRRIPFAFATGYGSQDLRRQYRGGATLQKPFEIGDLDVVIAALVRDMPAR